jgi:hypothetical protein
MIKIEITTDEPDLMRDLRAKPKSKARARALAYVLTTILTPKWWQDPILVDKNGQRIVASTDAQLKL